MSRRLGLATFVALVVAAQVFASVACAADSGAAVSVTVDRTRISTELGRKLVFRSTITNRGSTAASGLIAHLNVLSLRDGVYVDPEDWSSERTRYLRPIPGRGSTTTTWRIQAVNSGEFGVYVAVLREHGRASPPSTGPAIRLVVAQRRTLNSGGIVPVALGVPAVLGVLSFALRLRRRGLSRRVL
jgi:hypothetical protein